MEEVYGLAVQRCITQMGKSLAANHMHSSKLVLSATIPLVKLLLTISRDDAIGSVGMWFTPPFAIRLVRWSMAIVARLSLDPVEGPQDAVPVENVPRPVLVEWLDDHFTRYSHASRGVLEDVEAGVRTECDLLGLVIEVLFSGLTEMLQPPQQTFATKVTLWEYATRVKTWLNNRVLDAMLFVRLLINSAQMDRHPILTAFYRNGTSSLGVSWKTLVESSIQPMLMAPARQDSSGDEPAAAAIAAMTPKAIESTWQYLCASLRDPEMTEWLVPGPLYYRTWIEESEATQGTTLSS